MIRRGKPRMSVLVWGDWYTVLKAAKYRDYLLDHPPLDEDGAEYGQYRIPCDDANEIIDAFTAFRDLNLRCAIEICWTSDDKAVSVTMQSSDGWDSSEEPACVVEVRESEIEAKKVIKEAITLLKGALA